MSCENQIAAVDLFCDAGGLTHGLNMAGVQVRLGVNVDPICRFSMEANNDANFMEADIAKLMPSDVLSAFVESEVTLLAGCAPCQPFSSYSQSARRNEPNGDWELLSSFSKLIQEVRPTLVTMENVPPLRKRRVFGDFVVDLLDAGYFVDFELVDDRNIGIPQTRRRLVLVASLLGPITIPETAKPTVTVRDAISCLRPIEAALRIRMTRFTPLPRSVN